MSDKSINRHKRWHARHLPVLILVVVGLVSVDTEAFLLQQSGSHALGDDPLVAEPATATGIREIIPAKYGKRYDSWKKEFLSTETGRSQWERYAQQPRFTLTITVSKELKEGGETDQFKWDDLGRLMAATITLGSRIDEGYPSSVNYPVLNSLTPRGPSPWVSGNTLAAAKIAHEFGHLNRMAARDEALFQLQTQSTLIYYSILRSNGQHTDDPRLIKLAQQMGGTPVEIWEDNEHRAEANVLLFLADRFENEGLLCSLFKRIRENVMSLQHRSAEHSIQITESYSSLAPCAARQRRKAIKNSQPHLVILQPKLSRAIRAALGLQSGPTPSCFSFSCSMEGASYEDKTSQTTH